MKKFILTALFVLTLSYSAVSHAANICVDTTEDESSVNVLHCLSSCGTAVTRCSLREAITAANLAAPADRITFNISGDGPHNFLINSNLPPIVHPLIIDGTSEPSYVSGSAPVVLLKPGAAVTVGLDIRSSGVEVKGMQVLNFADDGIRVLGVDSAHAVSGVIIGPNNVISGNGEGIRIGENSSSTFVVGNLIGTNDTGTAVHGNEIGITLTNSSTHNVIGGSLPEDGNVISGSVSRTVGGIVYSGYGIGISLSTDNIIQNNKIGTDINGTSALPNQTQGISISGYASRNEILQNLISGNASHGILLTPNTSPFTARSNKIISNKIGVAQDGVSDLGNGGAGVYIDGRRNIDPFTTNQVENTQIGGLTGLTTDGHCSGDCNLIAFNAADGVYVANSRYNSIQGNSIHSNTALGINLDGGSGNEDQHAPAISEAVWDTDHFVVSGTFSGLASHEHNLQLFSNSNCILGAEQGETLVLSENIETDASGNAVFSVNVPILTGTLLTAHVTDNVTHNSSAFSSCFELEAAPSDAVAPASPADPAATGSGAGTDTTAAATSSGGGCSLSAITQETSAAHWLLLAILIVPSLWMRLKLCKISR